LHQKEWLYIADRGETARLEKDKRESRKREKLTQNWKGKMKDWYTQEKRPCGDNKNRWGLRPAGNY